MQKCEIISFCRDSSSYPQVFSTINDIPAVSTAKCLGYWWSRNLFASKSIEENIKKARWAFFSYGSIVAFQGDLNPLSSRSIIDSCVMPILLFGSENWILAETHLHTLEAFLGELAKRALKWPMHLSNTSAVLALDLETIRSRILCWKLWPKLWDSALHLGSRHTTSLRNLSGLTGHHGRGPHPYPLCDIQNPHSSVIDHILSAHHTDIQIDLYSSYRPTSITLGGRRRTFCI